MIRIWDPENAETDIQRRIFPLERYPDRMESRLQDRRK
jgi:hypothetical protein